MGYSYKNDNSPRMCFNAAKTWNLSWFKERHVTVDASHPSYIGKLTSVVVDPNETSYPVLIKLSSPNRNDYYINFNLKQNFNAGTKEGGDKVLIVEAASGYSESSLKAKLDAGETYEIETFDDEGNTLSIEVVSIDKSDQISDVRICLGDCLDDFTRSPTQSPTLASSDAPSPRPSTTRSTDSPTKFVSNSPTLSPTAEKYVSTSPSKIRSSSSPSIDTPSPSGTHSILCHDEAQKIPVLNHRWPKTCSWVGEDLSRCSLCSATDPLRLLSAYCPVTCRDDCQCYDVDFFYYNRGTRIGTCDWVAEKNLCDRSNKARSYCPKTCGIC